MQTLCIVLVKCYLAVICGASNRRDIAGMIRRAQPEDVMLTMVVEVVNRDWKA